MALGDGATHSNSGDSGIVRLNAATSGINGLVICQSLRFVLLNGQDVRRICQALDDEVNDQSFCPNSVVLVL